jgi:nucleotide-binding universal stress UspA family protein
MLQIKRILCPTDFSEAARRALDLAVPLAEAFEAELYVIHIVPAIRTWSRGRRITSTCQNTSDCGMRRPSGR